MRGTILFAALVAFVMSGCDDGKKAAAPPPKASGAPVGSSIASAPKVAASASAVAEDAGAALDPKAWVEEIKPRAVTAKIGDRVWAAVLDEGGLAGLTTRLTVHEVIAVKGNVASLRDPRGNTRDVSGGLIYPKSEASKMKPGDLVTALNGANLLVAQLVKADGAKPKVLSRGGAGVEELAADFVEPLATGIAPLAWVVYPDPKDPKASKRGVVFAVDGDRVYVVDVYGGWGFDKSKLKPWTFAKDFKAGDAAVYAGRGALVPVKIEKVEKPGVLYGLDIGGEKEPGFLGDLGALP